MDEFPVASPNYETLDRYPPAHDAHHLPSAGVPVYPQSMTPVSYLETYL